LFRPALPPADLSYWDNDSGSRVLPMRVSASSIRTQA
jgi:hypothetical protein